MSIDQKSQDDYHFGRFTQKSLSIILAGLVIAVLWLALKPDTATTKFETSEFKPPENSIAVLPFVDLSDEQFAALDFSIDLPN